MRAVGRRLGGKPASERAASRISPSLGGMKPELAVTGRRLLALMLEAKLLSRSVEIERVLAPGPLESMQE